MTSSEKTGSLRGTLVTSLEEKESLFAISSSMDALIGAVAESMARVNEELKKHAPPSPTTPASLLRLFHMVRQENMLQDELEKEIRVNIKKMGVIWKTLLDKGDEQSKNTAEIVGLKLAMVDYDLRCRHAGMESALAFPRRRLREMRRADASWRNRFKTMLGFLWKADVVLACTVLVSTVAFGWISVFWGMIIAGVLFFLAGLTSTVAQRGEPSG